MSLRRRGQIGVSFEANAYNLLGLSTQISPDIRIWLHEIGTYDFELEVCASSPALCGTVPNCPSGSRCRFDFDHIAQYEWLYFTGYSHMQSLHRFAIV